MEDRQTFKIVLRCEDSPQILHPKAKLWGELHPMMMAIIAHKFHND